MPGMVACSVWVRRGVAKSVPDKVALPKPELEKVIKELKEDIDDIEKEDDDDSVVGANGDSVGRKRKKGQKKPQEASKSEDDAGNDDTRGPDADEASDDIVSKYGLDDYDDDGGEEGAPWDTVAGLTYYATNDEDPYITIKDEDDASDRDDYVVKPTDNLLVVGRAAPECSLLEVHVYNDSEGSLYCHHDVILPAFPLAVEWINYDPGENGPGNLVAVGSMEPTIDLWDLDMVDTIEPAFVLGTKRTKRHKKKKGSVGSHSAAVLDLSWNSLSRTALASASADFTCGLWDLEECKLVTLVNHPDKVQSLRWHPLESNVLLTGSFDEVVRVYDCRKPDSCSMKWKVDGEVERVMWNAHDEFGLYASSEHGTVFYMDMRSDKKPAFTLGAHDSSVTGLGQSSEASTCLVTVSTDGFLKVWDVANNKPSCIHSMDMNVGKLLSLSRCPESSFSFAVGSEKDLRVYDVRRASSVHKHFCSTTGAEGDSAQVDAALGALSLSAEPPDSDEEDINEFFNNEMPSLNPKGATANSKTATSQKKAAATTAATQQTETRKKKKAKRKKPKQQQQGSGGDAAA